MIYLSDQPQTQTGLTKEAAAALSYILGPISGLLFLLLEKDEFIRFNAMQSIVVSMSALIVYYFLRIFQNFIPLPLIPLFGLLVISLYLVILYKVSQGEKWDVPVFGKITSRLLTKK